MLALRTLSVVGVVLVALCSLTPGDLAAKDRDVVYPAALFTFEERGSGVKELGGKVSDLLFAKLAAEPAVYLVDRVELQKTLAEQSLNVSGAVSSDQAVKIGNLTGAQLLITGSVLQVDKQLVLVAKIIGTQSSRVIGTSVEGKLTDELSPLVQKLAASIAELVADRSAELVPKIAAPKDRLAALVKSFQKRDAKSLPSLMINVAERHVGQQTVDPAVETELSHFATQLGFTVIDSKEGSVGQADVTLSGEGFSETVGRVGELVAVRARVELKAVDRVSGKILFADRQTVMLLGAAEQIAGKSALQEAGAALAERALPQIADAAKKSKKK